MKRRSAMTMLAGMAGGAIIGTGFCSGLPISQAYAATGGTEDDAVDLIAKIREQLAANGDTVEEVLRSFGYEDAAAEFAEGTSGSSGATGPRRAAASNQTKKALRASVTAIGASFLAMGYKLSAELALHGLDLTRTGTTYVPKNGSIAGKSATVAALRKKTAKSGSATFNKTGGTIGYDLYYSIHKFNWSKSGGKTIIRDVHDFQKGDYAGIQQKVINVMVAAQRQRAIYPFNIKITV